MAVTLLPVIDVDGDVGSVGCPFEHPTEISKIKAMANGKASRWVIAFTSQNWQQ